MKQRALTEPFVLALKMRRGPARDATRNKRPAQMMAVALKQQAALTRRTGGIQTGDHLPVP